MSKRERLIERRRKVRRSIGRLKRLERKVPDKAPFRLTIGKALGQADKRLHKSQAKLTEEIKRLDHATGYPLWLPKKWQDKWARPWMVESGSSKDQGFKALLWDKGYLSPNFTREEAGGVHRNPNGCPVPSSLRKQAQYHAFRLERVRHAVGDKPMGPLSWYRCTPHNDAVGGARNSQHLQAWATDWSDAERARLGSDAFNKAMKATFANGGIGTYRGNVRHVDNGPKRTWSYG